MNRLVIIGNGFDIAHGLKTSYKDFINWYWDQRVLGFTGNLTDLQEDCLCRIKIKDKSNLLCWNVFAFSNSYFRDEHGNIKFPGSQIIEYIKDNPALFSIEYSSFFDSIIKSVETNNWVDIENEYYTVLKKIVRDPNYGMTVDELNSQLSFLQDKLIEYLKSIPDVQRKNDIASKIIAPFKLEDISSCDSDNAINSIELCYQESIKNNELNPQFTKYNPRNIVLLSFNYTNTVELYTTLENTSNIYIHGNLEHSENIIFGYGDELDKDFKDIVDRNENELLKNVKSVKYLETDNYKKMLNFIESEPFQVFIMGHSCGNSDRTLLNTIFEHKNCVSIKPFYYIKDDGTDNYLELVQNIYRNFTDLKLYRDRVVNKTQCQTM